MVSEMKEEYIDTWVSMLTTWDSALVNHNPNSASYAEESIQENKILTCDSWSFEIFLPSMNNAMYFIYVTFTHCADLSRKVVQ